MATPSRRHLRAGRGRPRGVTPDAEKIFALIEQRGYLTLSAFADSIDRHPQSLRNIRNGNVERISLAFANDIATGLGEDVTEIIPALKEAA